MFMEMKVDYINYELNKGKSATFIGIPYYNQAYTKCA